MKRDWELLDKLSRLRDDDFIGVNEAAALTNFAPVSIRQRRVKNFPPPLPGLRHLRWKIGQIRAWGNEVTATVQGTQASPATAKDAATATPKARAKHKVGAREVGE